MGILVSVMAIRMPHSWRRFVKTDICWPITPFFDPLFKFLVYAAPVSLAEFRHEWG